MTPKEKAEELVDRYFNWYGDLYYFNYDSAKECALIAVDEILSFIEDERDGFNWKKYYQEVKNEIEKL